MLAATSFDDVTVSDDQAFGGALQHGANDMTVDDIDMVDTLYSAQAGGDCSYLNNFRTIVGN